MKTRKLILVLLLAVGQWSCRNEAPVTTELKLDGTWQLEKIVSSNAVIRKPAARQGVYDVSVTFKGNGELEATSVNNYLTGFYEISQQNGMMLGGDGTRRREPAWGSMFVNALPEVSFYELLPKQLILHCNTGEKLIFSRSLMGKENLVSSR